MYEDDKNVRTNLREIKLWSRCGGTAEVRVQERIAPLEIEVCQRAMSKSICITCQCITVLCYAGATITAIDRSVFAQVCAVTPPCDNMWTSAFLLVTHP